MTETDLETVLAPKVTGAWNLHLQTRHLALDCFVLFSSVSSIFGTPAQANYAAANAFLDALASHRRSEGLPGLSVNWSQIADVGVVADHPEVGRFLQGVGVHALSSRDALATLAQLIASDEAQVAVMGVDWEKISRASIKFSTSPVFRDLVQAGKSNQFADGTADDWRDSVLSLEPEQQVGAASKLLISQLAATLGTTEADIDEARPFSGMDSLMAVELKVRIESHTGCELPIDVFNAELTVEGLADRLLQQLRRATLKGVFIPDSLGSVSAGSDENIVAPLLRKETLPLSELIRARSIEPLAAAALMSWPDSLFDQTKISADAFFEQLNGGRVFFNLIFETPLGSVGIFMLPFRTSAIKPLLPTLLSHSVEGIRQATECGARCIALTGLIASASNYGSAIQAACNPSTHLASLTTGHNTTIAAVILNLTALLNEAGREIEEEVVMFYGVGSIGLGALSLMLDVLPHPAELHLSDPFRSKEYFAQLETTLRRDYGFNGPIRILGSDFGTDCYDATVIVGATNVGNVLDVDRLAPGTLMVDDSAPHCLNGPEVLARFRQKHDILCTEGGFVRSTTPMPRITHVPEAIAQFLPAELPELFLSFLTPYDITACILSALISANNPDLPPTTGLTTGDAARRHWDALAALGFTAADLNYEGTPLHRNDIAAFRQSFGKAAISAPSVAAVV